MLNKSANRKCLNHFHMPHKIIMSKQLNKITVLQFVCCFTIKSVSILTSKPFHQPYYNQSTQTSCASWTNHCCPRGSAPGGGHYSRSRESALTNQLLTVDRKRQIFAPDNKSVTRKAESAL